MTDVAVLPLLDGIGAKVKDWQEAFREGALDEWLQGYLDVATCIYDFVNHVERDQDTETQVMSSRTLVTSVQTSASVIGIVSVRGVATAVGRAAVVGVDVVVDVVVMAAAVGLSHQPLVLSTPLMVLSQRLRL